jgi:hypothetical protein
MKNAVLLFVTIALASVTWARAAPAKIVTTNDAFDAYKKGELPAFATPVQESLRQELGNKKLDENAVVRLASLRTFSVRFASTKLDTPDDARTLEWLIKHPTLGPLLLTALSPRDNPARVLSVLSALRTNFGKTVEQFPELTVATCVVWDSPVKEDQAPQQANQAACDIFAHLTQNRKQLRADPQSLPWPVLLYLVDSRITPQERQWALNTYRLPADPGAAYFQVRYDMGAFSSGQWRGGQQPYTLANIQKLGGVCKDEAYFATEVARAYGIPATVCTGQSGAGEGFHAWVGLLKNTQRRAAWDFETARYPEHGFWSGTVIDPQTGQKLTDGEAAMTAEWCFATSENRLLSLALTQSLDLLDQPHRIATCKAAIEAVPGNQQAWTALVNECAQPQTPPATVQEVAAVIERFAVGRYDDFAFKSFTTLLVSANPEQQLTVLDRVAKFFPNRPDLLADLALRKGDALCKLSRPLDGLHLYEQVLQASLKYGPIALEAIARVDAMLRPAGKMRELIDHYRVAWNHMLIPEESGYAWTTPWYIMGDRYAKILDESGDKLNATKVRQTIRARDLSHHDESPKQ